MSYRHEAASEHQAAMDNLLAAIMTDLGEFAAGLGQHGSDQVFLFSGSVPDGFDPEADAEAFSEADADTFYDTLGSLTISDSAGTTRVTMTDTNHWPDAVDLWTALRDALGHRFRTDIGPGLLVDTTTSAVAVWEPLYCPDTGPVPDAVLDCTADDHDDPFQSLLTDSESKLDQSADRLLELIVRYDLDEPTVAGHAAGACGE